MYIYIVIYGFVAQREEKKNENGRKMKKKRIQQNLETWSAMLSNNNDLLLRAILK